MSVRKVPTLTPDDWDVVVQWRPLIYQIIRKFGSKVMAREVFYRGRIGEDSFEWIAWGQAYGEDAVSILQDMEARALEAAAVAAHGYDSEKAGGKGISAKYIERVVWRALIKEFREWQRINGHTDEFGANVATVSYGSTSDPEMPTSGVRQKRIPEPSYLDPHDVDDEPSVLDPETEARLEQAMGALSSKEAWGLRMLADGLPVEVIAENLGFKNTRSAYNLLADAKDKARAAYEEELT